MKVQDEVSTEKLRGGFYSPDDLVDLCWRRIASLVGDAQSLTVLEPSAGDGAFIRGLTRQPLIQRIVSDFTAIEILAAEAEKCRSELTEAGICGRAIATDSVGWALETPNTFDVAIGNPPYVRFQFFNEQTKIDTARLAKQLGLQFTGVSNLWLPVLLSSLSLLRPQGAFAFIVPAECFTGISARTLRNWLISNSANLEFDLFQPGSFPAVLQEVIVLSGSYQPGSATAIDCLIREHGSAGAVRTFRHRITDEHHNWTRYLLSSLQLEAFDEAVSLRQIRPLGELARIQVAAVTGANSFFSVTDEVLNEFGLAAWGIPLLPRLRHAKGLTFTSADHQGILASGENAYLLDFSAERQTPFDARVQKYIQNGVDLGLPDRFKCRIRHPWYRIPHIREGELLLSKRAHRHHRMIANRAGVVTTDTIYRGQMLPDAGIGPDDLVCAFHNSFTLLAAEIEGRSFGGGVLELVPSEITRLPVPVLPSFGEEMERLDELTRSNVNPENGRLIEETDQLLVKADIGLHSDILDRLHEARIELLGRRLFRNDFSKNSDIERSELLI